MVFLAYSLVLVAVFSPICDYSLPTVAICDSCEVLSIDDNLFAVLFGMSIANDNSSFLLFLLAFIASDIVLMSLLFSTLLPLKPSASFYILSYIPPVVVHIHPLPSMILIWLYVVRNLHLA